MNRPGFPEAVSLELRCHGWFIPHGVVALVGSGRRDGADGLQCTSLLPAEAAGRGEPVPEHPERSACAVRLTPPADDPASIGVDDEGE